MLKKIDDVISDVDPRPALLVSSFISSIFDLSCCILFQKENPYIGQYLLKKKQWPGRVRVPIKKGGGSILLIFLNIIVQVNFICLICLLRSRDGTFFKH